jgi:hypothetical protein
MISGIFFPNGHPPSPYCSLRIGSDSQNPMQNTAP